MRFQALFGNLCENRPRLSRNSRNSTGCGHPPIERGLVRLFKKGRECQHGQHLRDAASHGYPRRQQPRLNGNNVWSVLEGLESLPLHAR